MAAQPPTSPNSPRKLMRAAFMAGAGASAADIADEIGGSPASVYAALSRAGIRLTPKTHNQVVVNLVISKAALSEAEKIAVVRRVEPILMISRLLQACLEERSLALNLVDEII